MFKGFTTEKQATTPTSSYLNSLQPYIEWETPKKSKHAKKRKKKSKKGGKASNHTEIDRELIPTFHQAIAVMDRTNQRLCELLERSWGSAENNRRGVWINGNLCWIRRRLLPTEEVVL